MDKLSAKLLELVCASSEGLQFYQIYRRMYLSPNEFSTAIRKLVSEELLIQRDSSLIPTSKGLSTALKNAMDSSLYDDENTPWKKIPDQFLSYRLPINLPYAPSARKFIIKSKNIKKNSA